MRNALLIIIASLVLFSCSERSYKNPFDPDVTASQWAPKALCLQIRSDSVKLSWENSAVLDVNYKILRKLNDGADEFTIIDSTENTHFTDVPPFNNNGYKYSVRAYIEDKLSDTSAEAAIDPVDAGTVFWSLQLENNIRNIAVSDNGDYFAVVESILLESPTVNVPRIQIIESETGGMVWTLIDTVSLSDCIDISSDNSLLAVGHLDGGISVYNLMTGNLKWRQAGDGSVCRQACFSSCNQKLVTGHSSGTINIWNAVTGEREWNDLLNSSVAVLEISQTDNKIAVADYSNQLYLYEIETGSSVWNVPVTNTVKLLVFSPEGDRLAAGLIDGTLLIFNSSDGTVLLSDENTSGMTFDIDFNHDGTRLCSAAGHLLKSVGVEGVLWETNFGNFIHSVSLNGNDKIIAAGGQFETLCLLNAETGVIKNQISVESTVFDTGFIHDNLVVWFYYNNILKTCWAIDTWKEKE